jgi:hypothetical protein
VYFSSSTTSTSGTGTRLALIVFDIDLKKLLSIVGLPLFLERPEGPEVDIFEEIEVSHSIMMWIMILGCQMYYSQ